jgi:hypothetical protein
MASPESRVDAIAVASPKIKLVDHQIYGQMNRHDFGGHLVVVLLKYCIKWTVVNYFLQQLLNKKPDLFTC